MDPLFLLAVIATESQFNLKAHGLHGEIGLMQILPKTAHWLATRAGLPRNFDLHDPAVNIRVGAAYFARLRKKFNGIGTRYVAAYNMGTSNVRRLLALRAEPRIYPDKVLVNYRKLYGALASNVTGDSARHVASMR
jgi:soluble lytic murein transglycosylase